MDVRNRKNEFGKSLREKKKRRTRTRKVSKRMSPEGGNWPAGGCLKGRGRSWGSPDRTELEIAPRGGSSAYYYTLNLSSVTTLKPANAIRQMSVKAGSLAISPFFHLPYQLLDKYPDTASRNIASLTAHHAFILFLVASFLPSPIALVHPIIFSSSSPIYLALLPFPFLGDHVLYIKQYVPSLWVDVLLGPKHPYQRHRLELDHCFQMICD